MNKRCICGHLKGSHALINNYTNKGLIQSKGRCLLHCCKCKKYKEEK